MSSVPPPPPPPQPPSPGFQPPPLPSSSTPGWSGPTGSTTPASGAVPTPPPGSPAPSATRPGRSPKVLVAGVVGIVVVLVLVFVVAFGGDDGEGPVDVAAALASVDGLDEALDDQRQDAIDDESDVFVVLDDCPTGDLSDAIDRLPEGLDPVEDPGDELTWALTFTEDENEPISYQCYVGSEEAVDADGNVEGGGATEFAGTLVARASERSHQRYVRNVLDGYDIDFGEDEPFRGGEIVTFCAEPEDEDIGGSAFCEADWVGGGLQVGVYVTTDPDNLSLVRDWLVASLDVMVKAVAAADGQLSIAVGSS